MMRLLCRNVVTDYDAWWAVFASHAEAHREAGLGFLNGSREGSLVDGR